MTTAADDAAVEEAFEAFLAGRRVPGPDIRLASFTDAVRASATEPGRPNAALAELLATGLLTDQTGAAVRPARRSRRRRTRMLASALFAKIASAGLIAKAATAAGVTVVGLATAGFTGNLGPAQNTFATLVDHATPFTAPTGTSTGTTPTSTDPAAPATAGQTATPAATPSGAGAPATSTPFGQQVSQMAHDGHDGKPGVDGQAVSSMARARHSDGAEDGQDAQESPDGQDAEKSGDDTRDGSGRSAAVTSAPAGPETHQGDSGGKGHGDH